VRAQRTVSDRRRPVVPGSDAAAPRHGLARVLSKQGVCSRSEAARWILAGRVRVDGRVVRDPEFPIVQGRQRIGVDDDAVVAAERIWLMLNKPRGLLTTASDEQGRDTVYRCLDDAGLPWLAPVGRLDKASDAQFAADPDEGGDRAVEVLAGVRGAHLRADARLALGHDREEEADRVDAFLEQARRSAARAARRTASPGRSDARRA
jgi:hypothetical protein